MNKKILSDRIYTFKKKKITNVDDFFSKFKSIIGVKILKTHECGDLHGLIFQRVGQYVYAFIFNLEIESKGCKLTTKFYTKVTYNEKQLDLFGDELDRIECKYIGELCENKTF